MWLYLSLLFALLSSFGILLGKKLAGNYSPILLSLLIEIFLFPFILLLIFLFFQIPHTTFLFYKLLLICGVFDTVAAILYYKALSISEISLLSPISSFNPVFTLVFAVFFLDEKPTLLKLIGIIIIVFGAYLLNISSIKTGL